MPSKFLPVIRSSLFWGLSAFFLYFAYLLYLQQEFSFALLVLVVCCSGCYVYTQPKLYYYRYVFPAIAGMLVFVIFPMLYTFGISFTNYSSENLLNYQRAKTYLLQSTYLSEQGKLDFKLVESDTSQSGVHLYQIWLKDNTLNQVYISEPMDLSIADSITLPVQVTEVEYQRFAPVKVAIQHRNALNALRIRLPDGTELQKLGFRHFAALSPLYVAQENDALQNQQTGTVYQANFDTGFFEDPTGQRIAPGFTVAQGWQNYVRIVSHDGIRKPFLHIFIWSVSFAALSVLFTLTIGLILACLVSWEPIKGKATYRVLLILPYAVPAFISILIFRGLFNPSEGEINKLLSYLFSIRPEWFIDPLTTKMMTLIVNTWLGYPYMMILCLGLLQSIPKDIYESSAIEGAGVFDNFFKLTLPMIVKPMLPLLIASFAFNFNNFVLVNLLTGGGPDMIGTTTPAGTTDLLVSYTYRIAFEGDKRDMALAAAISTLIFILVAVLSYLHLRFTKIKVAVQ